MTASCTHDLNTGCLHTMVDCSTLDLKRKISNSSTEVSPSIVHLNKRQALNMSSDNSSAANSRDEPDQPPISNPGVTPTGAPEGGPYAYQFIPGLGPVCGMPGFYPPQMTSTPGPRPIPPSFRPMVPPPSDIPGVSDISDSSIQKIAAAVKYSIMQELCQYVEARVEARVQPLCLAYNKLQEENQVLSQRIDDLEMYSRRSCVRIFGVSEEKVDTDQVVKDICTELKVELKSDELAVSHRVGKKSADKPRPIIARITNYSARHELLKESKKQKLHKMKDFKDVWVNQDLTKSRGKVAAEVRKLVKSDEAKSSFIWDGKIFLIDHSETKHKFLCMNDLINALPEIRAAKAIYDAEQARIEAEKAQG